MLLKNIPYKTTLVGIVLYLISMIIVHFNKSFSLHWYAFFLWVAGIVICLFGLGFPVRSIPSRVSSLFTKKFSGFWIITVLAVFTRFLFIWVYPYHSIGDEMRTGGIDPRSLANGTIKNLFGYEAFYESHGHIIQELIIPFRWIFHNTSWSYRIPATLLSITTIILLYFLVRKYSNERTAFCASLILICLPIDLYYARTEVVLIFSNVLTVLLLWGNRELLERGFNYRYFGIFGLLIGFSLGFYASVRTIIFLTLAYIGVYTIFTVWKNKEWRRMLQSFCVFIIMVFVGFGPRLLFTPPRIFFHSNTVPTITKTNSFNVQEEGGVIEKFIKASKNYPKSFMVYIYEPTTSHFSYRSPILNVVLAVFFIIGLVLTLFKKNQLLNIAALFAVITPFTNSAITDWVNADHRITPLLIFASVITAFGFIELIDRSNAPGIKNVLKFVVLSNILVISLFLNVYNFFKNEPASYGMFRFEPLKVYEDFMVTQAIKDVGKDQKFTSKSNLCVGANSDTYKYLRNLHVDEQFRYYLEGKSIEYIDFGDGPELNALYLFTDCTKIFEETSWNKKSYCEVYKKFICPPDKKSFTLYFGE